MKKENYLDYKITEHSQCKEVSEKIIEWLKKYSIESNTKGFVVGVSGGIDSAVVAILCAKTGIPTLLLEMPIHQDKDQVNRASEQIWAIKEFYENVSSLTVDLTDTYETFKNCGVQAVNASKEQFEFSMSNSRSRLRMMTLYQFAGQLNRIVVGTGNKVEDYGIGFFTKFGDGGVDISPIGELLKTEVYALGKYLGVSNDILSAAPTDGLHEDGRTDEDQIGASYPELEWAMYIIDETCKNSFSMNPYLKNFRLKFLSDFDNIIASAKLIFQVFSEREIEVLKIYLKMHTSNSHKMDLPPIFEVNR